MVAINPQKIIGKWKSGIALDLHTTSSTYLGVDEAGHNQYDNTRSELGDLLYRLKYRSDQMAAPEIIATAAQFLMPHRHKFDLIIPVPSSTVRAVQPVTLLANGIGKAVSLPVCECVTMKRRAEPIKSINDAEQRRKALEGLHAVDASKTAGRRVLLFDDLFRSGSTMNAITDILLVPGAKGRADM